MEERRVKRRLKRRCGKDGREVDDGTRLRPLGLSPCLLLLYRAPLLCRTPRTRLGLLALLCESCLALRHTLLEVRFGLRDLMAVTGSKSEFEAFYGAVVVVSHPSDDLAIDRVHAKRHVECFLGHIYRAVQ